MKWRIDMLESVDSTQEIVKDKVLSENAPEGYVLQALEQTKGKGRHGNVWISPPGNLYMSVLLRPDCIAEDAGHLAFVAALAVSNALDDFIGQGHDKKLKWPNDILVDGKKMSGILLETGLVSGRVDYVVVGIGINVDVVPEGRIGLKDVGKGEVALEALRDNVLQYLAAIYKKWMDKGFEPIRAAWLAQACGIGEKIIVRMPDAEIRGVFDGLDEEGCLILKDKSGNERRVKSGEVFFG